MEKVGFIPPQPCSIPTASPLPAQAPEFCFEETMLQEFIHPYYRLGGHDLDDTLGAKAGLYSWDSELSASSLNGIPFYKPGIRDATWNNIYLLQPE
jgi:hypothetical protein